MCRDRHDTRPEARLAAVTRVLEGMAAQTAPLIDVVEAYEVSRVATDPLSTGGKYHLPTLPLAPRVHPAISPRDRRPGGRGGTGRRAGFRFQYRKMWGFESLRPHQFRKTRNRPGGRFRLAKLPSASEGVESDSKLSGGQLRLTKLPSDSEGVKPDSKPSGGRLRPAKLPSASEGGCARTILRPGSDTKF